MIRDLLVKMVKDSLDDPFVVVAKDLLEKQEKQSKKVRRTETDFMVIWKMLFPDNKRFMLQMAIETGNFYSLKMKLFLGINEHEKLWNLADDPLMERVFEEDKKETLEIIEQMSGERRTRYFETIHGYCTFQNADFHVQKYLFEEVLSKDDWERYLCISAENNEIEILEFSQELFDKEGEIAIFERIAALNAEVIAQLLELATMPTIVGNIVQCMVPEQIAEVCQEIKPENLYRVLQESQYELLLRCQEGRFPVSNLNQEECRDLFEFLEDAGKLDFCKRFDSNGMAVFFVFCNNEQKEMILQNLPLSEVSSFYDSLPKEAKRDLLESLFSWNPILARHILLERGKKLDFWEAMALESLIKIEESQE